MQKEIARYLFGPSQHLVCVYAPPFKKDTALERAKSRFSFHPHHFRAVSEPELMTR